MRELLNDLDRFRLVMDVIDRVPGLGVRAASLRQRIIDFAAGSVLELQVRELLAAAQQERKAKLDAIRVDTVCKVGVQVLLRTKELLDAADIGKLRPRWDGPFTVTACPSPNAYTLALPRCSPTVNVDRLKPFQTRADEPPAPGPVSDPGQEGEHEVELLRPACPQPTHPPKV
jgi:hypothetical protein